MKRIALITKIMLKAGTDPLFNNLGTKKQKDMSNNKKIGTMILFAFLALYLIGIVGFLSYMMINYLVSLNQAIIAIYALFTLIGLLTLVWGIIIIPSIYYFSDDVTRYLVLPIKNYEFIVAKFITAYIQIQKIFLVISILYLGIYSYLVGFSLLFSVYFLLAALFVPLIPLAMILLLIVIAFRFIPFVRNKNLFIYIVTIVGVVFAVYINIVANSMTDSEGIMNAIIAGFNGESNSLLPLLNNIFPATNFALQSLTTLNPVGILITIVLSLTVSAVVLVLCKDNYLKSALSMNESSASSKKLSDKKFAQQSTRKGVISTFLKTDFKNILRTPIFATNYFIPLLIVPVIFAFSFLQESSNIEAESFTEIILLIQDFIAQLPALELFTWVLSLSFMLAFAAAIFTTITSTAFSREGVSMKNYLVLPLRFRDMIIAKIVLGVLVTIVLPSVALVAIAILFKLNVLATLIGIIGLVLGSFSANIMAILLDVFFPKLSWSNEQQAVKQNFLSIIPMFGGMGLVGVFIFLLFVQNPLSVLVIYPLFLISAACIIARFLLKKGDEALRTASMNLE